MLPNRHLLYSTISASMTRRILMIAPYFPPRRRVASLRSFRFATHLRELGWDVAVAHIRESANTLSDDEQSALQGIHDWPMTTPLDRTTGQGSESDIGESSQRGAKRKSVTASPLARQTKNVLSGAGDWIDRAVPVDTWLPILLAAYPGLLRRARQWQPDIIWSTANPWSSHVLAELLARSLCVPWVADFRDPWTLATPYKRTTPRLTQTLDRIIERRILDRADAITFTASTTAERTIEAFGLDATNVHVFPNSYDSRLFERANMTTSTDGRRITSTTNARSNGHADSRKDDDRIELLFFGRFRETSSAEPLIRILHALKERQPDSVRKLVVRSAGPLPSNNQQLALELGVLDCFETFDSVAYERAPARLAEADILIVCKPPDRAEIVPAKLWDYLYVRKPVLAISDNREVRDIIAATGVGAAFDNSEYSAVAELLARIVAAPAHMSQLLEYDPVESEIARYDADQVSKQLAEMMEDLIVKADDDAQAR